MWAFMAGKVERIVAGREAGLERGERARERAESKEEAEGDPVELARARGTMDEGARAARS